MTNSNSCFNISHTVEVFKTNVDSVAVAQSTVRELEGFLPAIKVNFDLTDPDNILRIEGLPQEIDAEAIITYLRKLGIKAERLV